MWWLAEIETPRLTREGGHQFRVSCKEAYRSYHMCSPCPDRNSSSSGRYEPQFITRWVHVAYQTRNPSSPKVWGVSEVSENLGSALGLSFSKPFFEGGRSCQSCSGAPQVFWLASSVLGICRHPRLRDSEWLPQRWLSTKGVEHLNL